MTQDLLDARAREMRLAFYWTRFLGAPFWVLITLLPVILYKAWHITPLQLTLFVVLKPVSALLAPYWGSHSSGHDQHLTSRLVRANILRYIPFLFLPWIDSPWLVLGGMGFYMMMTRGAMPGWMEIFKRHLPSPMREQVFAQGNAMDYLISALLPLPFGLFLDWEVIGWRWLFALAALVGMFSTWFLYRFSQDTQENAFSNSEPVSEETNGSSVFLRPWKQAWELIQRRPDFTTWLWGWMLGGAGLMIMQPALPLFFVDHLQLSYTEVAVAISACKGLGFAATASYWARLYAKEDIYRFGSWVTVLASLFPFMLIAAQWNLASLYLAYLFYGMMQSGSELCWHLSGPHFAGDSEDSAPYTNTNILLVGLRGAVIPFLGTFLCSITSASIVMISGSFFCFAGTVHLWRHAQERSRKSI